jgi:ankyrin repeat protein
MTAAECSNPRCLSILLEAGANINATDKNGSAALKIACESNHISSAECVSVCLNYGANINRMNYDGITALMTAAEFDNVDCMSILLARGANVNYAGSAWNRTALYYAAREGNTDCVSLLIENGADIELGRRENTALHIAAVGGHADCVALLLENGADKTTVHRDYSLLTEDVRRLLIDAPLLTMQQLARNAIKKNFTKRQIMALPSYIKSSLLENDFTTDYITRPRRYTYRYRPNRLRKKTIRKNIFRRKKK